MESIESSVDKNTDQQYFEIAYNNENQSKSNLLFKKSDCPSKKAVKVICNTLECGARPQAVKPIARYHNKTVCHEKYIILGDFIGWLVEVTLV